MIHRLRSSLTYANVVASLALFIALGGSAYAVATGAIGSREIRDNSIRSRDVHTNALSGRDINERSLQAAPKVYTRQSGINIALNRAGSRHTARCNRGDTAVGGSAGATGDQLSFHETGFVHSESSTGPPNGYTGVLYGEPSAAGQQRFMTVSVVCLAKARR